MKRLRILLFPLAVIIEMFALLLCWLVMFINLEAAEKMVFWVTVTLPDLDWYLAGWEKE